MPQIEVKANPTDAQIADLISTVRAYGMEKSVMWLGGQAHMQKIVDLCPVACVGRYYNGSLTDAYVLEYAALHTGYNRVYFEVAWDNYDSNRATMFERLLKHDIVSGIYGINLSDDILSLDKRMQIISTDRLVAADVIREANE